jgi:hypothetical protein
MVDFEILLRYNEWIDTAFLLLVEGVNPCISFDPHLT